MNKSFKILNTIIIALICLNIISSFGIFFTLGKNTSAKKTSAQVKTMGTIKVQVLDDTTSKPIDNATVCVIESRHYENTNKYGYTSYIFVPIVRNTSFDISCERNWGELTLLVYKGGYADNLSFYNEVKPGTTKVGIVIRLRPIINEEDKSPTISVSTPDTSWCNNLINLYKKRG